VGPPPTSTAAATSPTEATARWTAVVSHLDKGRTSYRAAGAAERDIEWAVQNARVVLQAMQLRASKVSRDQSGRQYQVDPRSEPRGENGGVGAQWSCCDRRLFVRDDGDRTAADVWAANASIRAFLQSWIVPSHPARRWHPEKLQRAASVIGIARRNPG